MPTLFYFLLACCAALCSGIALAQPTAVLPHSAQSPYTSIRHAENTFYRQFNFSSEAEVDSVYRLLNGDVKPAPNTAREKDNTCTLRKKVYGYHPYWVSAAAAANYQYDLLSTFIYFSYELNPATGSYTDIHFWRTSNAINLAKAAGCRVELCVTNFGSADNTAFLSNEVAWDRLIDSLIVLLPIRQADGVNIDFEGVPASQRSNFRAFMEHLHTRLNTALPGTEVSVAMPAVDWNNIFNLTEMDSYVDAFIIMGYDYHYSGDAEAGPVAPLYWGDQWSELSLYRSLNDYIAEAISPQKIIMAVPYYGYDWITNNTDIPAPSQSSGTSRTYTYLRQEMYGTYTRQWNEQSQTPYFMYISGGNTRQCWFDDEVSLGKRYDMVNSRNIGGTGMWALGYDNGYGELWDALREKFTDCGTPNPTITIYDTGGSSGQYRNNENYSLVLQSPDGTSPVTAWFTSLNMENNFDFIRIYDGNSSTAPLIATLTGNTLPPAFTSTGNVLTLQITTDGATRSNGFALQWSTGCSPTTAIQPIQAAVDDDNLQVNFDDADNCGSGISERFYQALSAPAGTNNWRGNAQRGFFNDDFDSGTLSGDWLAESGTWIYDDGSVQQIATANSNTNLYTALAQHSGKSWLYHWRMKIGSTGSNRRAGLHIFASDGDAENRGNSYFVYLRPDDGKVQLYKVTDNVFDLKTNDNATVPSDTWLDCKLRYNPADGTLRFYLNNSLVSSWTDSSPLSAGSYLSLRTGGCEANYDFVSVLQSRTGSSVMISMGSTPDNDIFPTGQQVRIVSIARNATHFTNLAYANVQFGGTVSIDTPSETDSSTLTLYPNPASIQTYVQISLPHNRPTPATLRLYDLHGKLVSAQAISYAGGMQSIPLSLANLPAATYIVSIQTPDAVVTRQLVVY